MDRVWLVIVLFYLISAPLSAGAQAAASAVVDRDRLALDETLTLTISREGGLFSSLDLAALEKDFTVLGQNRSSSTRIVNGQAATETTVQLVLSPRRAGSLTIPPLDLGGEKTPVITVEVDKEAAPDPGAAGQALFVEATVDAPSVMVQGQLLFTVRIFAAAGVEVLDPGPPQPPDAVVEALEPVAYEKKINGTSYRVFELRSALFPQKSGSLVIEGMRVQARVTRPHRARSFFEPTAGTETISRRTAPLTITVLPQSPDYPAGATWLPAAEVTVTEKWSRPPAELRVGDAVTVTIDLTAAGARAGQLPPVGLPAVDGLKLYPGKAETENRFAAGGIVGSRRETVVLVPTRPGAFPLPEQRIAWWNTKKSAVEYAVIPDRELRVVPGAESQAVGGDNAVRPGDKGRSAAPPFAGEAERPADRRWMLVCALLSIAWLVTLLLLFRLHRRLVRRPTPEASGNKRDRSSREREAFASLAAACRDNDPQAARQALLAWLRISRPDRRFGTLADICRLAPEKRLHCLLEEMDAILYSKDGTTGGWRGDELLAAAHRLRDEGKAAGDRGSDLPPLYPRNEGKRGAIRGRQ